MKFDDWLMLGVVGSAAFWVVRGITRDVTKAVTKPVTLHVPFVSLEGENGARYMTIPNLSPDTRAEDIQTCVPTEIEILGYDRVGKKRYVALLTKVAFEWNNDWPYVRSIGISDRTNGAHGYLDWDDIEEIRDETTGKNYRDPSRIAEYLRHAVGGVIDADFKKL